jgi:dUTP pyrophosphatase
MDLAAALSEDVVLKPGERSLISTGIMIALHPGLEAQIRPRSGLAYKDGLTVLNAPGTIDSDYRGEIKVLLINLGAQSFTLTRGMRIAQLVVAPVTQITWHLAEDLEEGTKSKRMAGGFGSTGLHAL